MESIKAASFIAKNRSNKSWDIILPLFILACLALLNNHNTAIKSEPTEWLAKSKRLINEGKNEQALEFSLKLLDLFPKNHIYLNQVAMLYEKVRQPAKQAEVLERFMLSAPDPSEVCLPLVEAYRQSEKPDLALKASEKCLSLDPKNSDFLFQNALSFERLGNIEKALELYGQGSKLHPGYTDFAIGYARMHLRSGNAVAAWNEIQEVLKTNPKSADAQMVAGLSAIKLDKWTEADRILTQAVQDHPNYQELKDLYKRVQNQLGTK